MFTGVPAVGESAASEPGLVGAVDEQGREIAITEEMIQQACADLAKRCQFPAARSTLSSVLGYQPNVCVPFSASAR